MCLPASVRLKVLNKLSLAIVEVLEVPTVMARSAAVSRPCAVTGKRRPRLRAAAAVFTEIREASEKRNNSQKNTTHQTNKSANKRLSKICHGNKVMMAYHTDHVKSKLGNIYLRNSIYLSIKYSVEENSAGVCLSITGSEFKKPI